MNTHTARKWTEYELTIESMHHVTSQTKGEKEKQIADIKDRKRGSVL